MLTLISSKPLRGRDATGRAAMNSIYRSILARSLMTGVASLAFTIMGAGVVRADIVIVQGDDGVAGDPGQPGGDGESVAADAGSPHPITALLNEAAATGGHGGNDGNGGAAGATAATAVISGSAEADTGSSGGAGGLGGVSGSLDGNGGDGGGATATSAATNAHGGPVASNATAEGAREVITRK
jgi:hypothetical protein